MIWFKKKWRKKEEERQKKKHSESFQWNNHHSVRTLKQSKSLHDESNVNENMISNETTINKQKNEHVYNIFGSRNKKIVHVIIQKI